MKHQSHDLSFLRSNSALTFRDLIASPALWLGAVLSFSNWASAEMLKLSEVSPVFRSENAGNLIQKSEPKAQGQKIVQSLDFRLAYAEKTETQLAGQTFTRVEVAGMQNLQDVGRPELPFQAWVVDGTPEEIQVEVKLGRGVSFQVGKVMPAQPELCRCADDKKRQPVLDYSGVEQNGYFRIQSLGDHRGVGLSQVLFFPYDYQSDSGTLTFYPQAEFRVISLAKKNERADLQSASDYDYLVLAPRAVQPALEKWIRYKESEQRLRFRIADPLEISSTAVGLQTWIQNEYKSNPFKYALIVGSQSRVPTHYLQTSDYSTPSDLPYFAMGGAQDYTPEVYAGRIIADTPEAVARITQKWIDYESSLGEVTPSDRGWKRVLGVASNEGSNPSDRDYVLSILNHFSSKMGTESVFFHQDDSSSNPTQFNQAMNQGSHWVTYMGHGSGTSWPSFGMSYGVEHIARMRNAAAVKPVWIDVACQNGRLENGMAGASLMAVAEPAQMPVMMNAEVDRAVGAPMGATAFYGGTVNISWHPPAILAKGIALEGTLLPDASLGEVLQAGHKYLAKNYSGASELRYNQIWYNLQGDPSMKVKKAAQ